MISKHHSKRTVILGPPGTGKTTKLLDIVNNALESGTEPRRIAFMSFTKKAAEEAVMRACERFGFKEKEFPHFRTLHSHAYKMMKISRAQVMNQEHFDDFTKTMTSYDFKHQYSDSIERAPTYGGLGDRCLRLYYLQKATRLSNEDTWRKYSEGEVSWHEFIEFGKALNRYKKTRLVFDFSDFLEKQHEPLDVDLFILDEAQDLTPQQWTYFEGICTSAGEVYVAGDDDQAIFDWAGSSVDRFLNFKGERIVLPITYRLPKQIHRLCCDLSGRITNRIFKYWGVAPDNKSGTIQRILHIEDIDISSGTWLLMARHGYQLEAFEEYCRDCAAPYTINHKHSIDHPNIKAILAYEHLRKGGKCSKKVAEKICSLIPKAELRDHWLTSYERTDFKNLPDGNWMESMTLLPIDDREYVRGMLRRKESLTKTPRIKISTIHASKGGEADNVVLLTDISKRTYENFQEDPDPEIRVWYVAVSRAKSALYLVEPRTSKFFEVF